MNPLKTPGAAALAFVGSLWLLPSGAAGQADSIVPGTIDVHTHVLHVTDLFEEAPGSQGLIRIALAEGEIAALHAGLAAEAVNSLNDVRLHVRHMLHAIDPALTLDGPGLGYGLQRATEEALSHIELAATSEAATDNVRLHALHVATVLGNTLRRSAAMVSLARDLDLVSSASGVQPLLARLTEEGGGLVQGQDYDGDGLVGWRAGEGGLRQATWHLTLLKRGEGLLFRE